MPSAAKKLHTQSYDLAAFERAPVRQPAQLRVIKRQQAARRDVTLTVALCFIMAIAISAMVVYNYMTLNELTAEINKGHAQYEMLQSEYRRLMVRSESELSLRKIEERARTQLGMAPIEGYQIEYIEVMQEEQVAVVSSPPSMLDRLWGTCASLVEYLRS